MSLKASSAPRSNIGVLVTALLALVLVAVAAIVLLSRESGSPAQNSTAGTTSDLLYVEFGATVDTVWRASVADSGDRERLLTIEHGIGFGIVPSLSPDRTRFVYTS